MRTAELRKRLIATTAGTRAKGSLRAFGLAAVIVAVASTGLSAAVAPASAVTGLESSSGVSPSSDLSNGSAVLVTTDAPFTVPGASVETITQTFDPANAPVRVNGWGLPDVTSPEGYALEYYYVGAWSSTPPSAVDGVFPTLQKVRAIGSNTISGWDSATASESYARGATSVPAPTKSFAGSGLGDGWDVFFGTGSAAGRIFNVYHHSWGTVGFECHSQLDGASCWTGRNLVMGQSNSGVPGGFWTSAHSTGFYSAAVDRVYTFVAHDDGVAQLGMACIKNVSTAVPSPCDVPFIPLVNAPAGYLLAGDAVQVGTKVYARGVQSGQNLLCFDLSTQAACSGQPFNIGSPSGNSAWYDTRLLAVGSDVYFSTGTALGCFDTVAGGLCSHFNSGATIPATTGTSLFYTETTGGTPDQVCAYGSQNCWKLDGTPGTWPMGLAYYYSSINDGWGAVHNSGTRMFYLSDSTAECFDFLTGAACAGFANPAMGGYAYAFATDSTNTQCVWGNSDQGVIKNFDWATGLPCPQKNTVMFRYTDSVPRLSCADTGRVTQWDAFTLHAPGSLDIANARISVYTGDGNLVSGWAGVPVTTSSDTQTGTLDLSGLLVSQSGLHPAFYISFVGADVVTGTTGDFSYHASAPQVCTYVQNFIPCPTGVGNGAPDFPDSLPDFGFESLVEFNGAGAGSETTTATASRAALTSAQCLLVPSTGFVRTDITDVPIPGAVVYLYGSDTTTPIETATTDVNGYFEFPTLYPNTYRVSISGHGVDSGVSSGAKMLGCLIGYRCANDFGTLIIPFKVHYDGNGSTSGTAPGDAYVNPGQTFTPTADPGTLAKSHYHFLGWGAFETSTSGLDTLTVIGDHTLYAVWEIDTHTLTVAADGQGSVAPTDGVHVFNYGDATIVRASADIGWAFTGWTGACSYFLPCNILMDSDKTVTATFKRLHSLDVTIVGGGSSSPGSSKYIEGSVLHFQQWAAPGYRFQGFTGDCAGTACDITMNTDHRVTLTFVRVYQLTTDVTGHGAVTPGGAYDRGDTATLTATPDTGWRFAGWTGDCSGGANPLAVAVSRDMVCTANFSDQPVLVPVPSGVYAPTDIRTSGIAWKAVAHATKYKITVNGKVVCTTSALACRVPRLLGPNSRVLAIAMTDTFEAIATQLKYRATSSVRMFVVNFAESSSTLNPADKRRLKSEALKIKSLGFNAVTVLGFTDSQGGSVGAHPLSTARAQVVIDFLRKFVSVRVSASGRGNTQFIANNNTEVGRSANRRAEGWVK